MATGSDRDSESGGDFDAAISDTRLVAATPPPVATGMPTAFPAARDSTPPFAPRRTPRQRFLRQVGVVATVLLALVIVTGGAPALRDGLVRLVLPPPAPTITPFSDLFTLLPNPPGVTVALDGRALAHPPAPDAPHPLRLAPGRHTFAWQSRVYPFVPQSCTVSVPAAPDDTCAFVASDVLIAQDVLAPSNVLAMHPSLFTLQSNDITSLQQAIQVALAASTSSATVQPGEPYYTLSDSGAESSTVAAQPLRATLSFALDTEWEGPDPCIVRQPDYLCRFQGQNCIDLCTLPNPPPNINADTPNAWITAAVVGASWTYTAPNGHIIGSYLDAGPPFSLVVLRITWDGVTWHVTPLFGHTPGLDATDAAACAPARYWLSNSTWAFMLGDPPPGSQTRFISGANPANGCLAILSRGPGTTGLFLERFGLLFTLNEVARSNSLDNFPSGDAAAQAQARTLAAQAGITLTS